ncbi:MAG: cytochrome c [Gemmatimonadetes bacterium]|jgi:mono/diheme cytochrome c family protein|nr:cytochrome c [Gemmatimonadota bacterium]MBP6669070.1 cytochrome c [Gemmatimonadales bacterium]MBK7717245.1 cytochrome c [Gemmatimonadota bacterium]MBK7925847.1 cytochrome c [Gemmatimonadota bacterium]MBK9066565.1 cytochrome c [Gemmatimonadota bacterium]
MRWVLRIGAALVALVVLATGTLWLLSNRALARRYDVTAAPITIPTDSAALARGRHLATAIGKCVDCHGENLGGTVMDMGPFGTFSPPNLTTGRGGSPARSDAEWVRTIRHGVGAGGRPLVFMPSLAYHPMTEADLGALIAYLKSVPPVDTVLPPTRLGPIARLVLARTPEKLLAASAIDHAAPFPDAIPAGPTAEYGRYLTEIGGCTSCHGADLKGGIHEGPPEVPASADLTPAGKMGSWSEEDFRKALREGVRPDGSVINPFMPWRLTRLMTDEEISAVWAYLKTR